MTMFAKFNRCNNCGKHVKHCKCWRDAPKPKRGNR